MPKRTRDKQLAKLAARRQAERAAARRRRTLAIALGAGTLAVILIVVAGVILLGGDDPAVSPLASATPSTAASGVPATCTTEEPLGAGAAKPTFDEAPRETIDPNATYTARIDTSCGTIRMDLLAETATESVNSFVFLARKGFYDGLTWHRLVKDFVIQGGDPLGDGTGGPGYETPVTVTEGSTFDAKGVVAFAHAADGGNGSQFFITLGPQPNLNPSPQGEYTIFGNVSKGMDVVETIGSFPTVVGPNCPPGEPCSPTQPVYINSVTIQES